MGVQVKTADYIKGVCDQNRLIDIADWLIRSDDEVYYADTHVSPPPEGLPITAAVEAGLALLVQWVDELGLVQQRGLATSNPMLVVDNEWLENLAEAPPPHVTITLAKRRELIVPQSLRGQLVDRAGTLFDGLLTGRLRGASLTKFEPSIEDEGLGGWVIHGVLAEG